MTDLPRGWARATISELAGSTGLVTDGDWVESKDQDPSGEVRLIQLADIGDGEFRDRSSRFLTAESARRLNCTYLSVGDLLVARMPDPLGRACIFPGVSQEAVTAVDVFIWRGGDDRISSKWLMNFINSPEVRSTIEAEAGGTTRQRIAGGRLKSLSLPVPPAPEQRRIVAKIDGLSAKSKRARDQLDHVPRLVEKYKESLLNSFYDSALGRCRSCPSLGELAIEVRNGLSKKPNDKPPGTPILRISAVRPGRVNLHDRRFYPLADQTGVKESLLRNGDLLFTRYNGNPDLVAVCGMVRGLSGEVVYPDKLIRVRLPEEVVLPEFAELVTQTPQFREQIRGFIKTAAGQHGISGSDLKTATIPSRCEIRRSKCPVRSSPPSPGSTASPQRQPAPAS